MTGYRSTPQGATLVWQLPPRCHTRGSRPPVNYAGHVYVLGGYPRGRDQTRDGEGPQFFVTIEAASGEIVSVWNHTHLGCNGRPFAAENTWFHRGEFKRLARPDSQPLPCGSVPADGQEEHTCEGGQGGQDKESGPVRSRAAAGCRPRRAAAPHCPS